MKAKTKEQLRVFDLSKGLKPLSDKDAKYFQDKFKRYIWTTSYYGVDICLECGDSGCDCNKTAVYKRYTKVKGFASEKIYVQTIQKVEDYNVVRTFLLEKLFKKTHKAVYLEPLEVAQHWYNYEGKCTIIGRTTYMGFYLDNWSRSSELEVRHNHDRYNIHPDYCIVKSTTQVLKRNGFKGAFHGIAPYKLISLLLTDPKAETLIKAKQYKLLHYYSKRNNFHWHEFKIANKNGYKIKDAITWHDYITMIKQVKHTHSDYYPEDLHKAHQNVLSMLNVKRKREEEKRRREEQLDKEVKLIGAEERYLESKGKYLDICIEAEDITIRPLKSVSEFAQVGDMLKHCIYENFYFDKPTLILGAWYKDDCVETTELDLDEFEIIQSRGYDNQPTPFTDTITHLIQQHKNLFIHH